MTASDALHRRLLTLDAHLDAPVHFSRSGWDFGDRHALENDVAQVDLPRMEDGNLTGGFFVTYTEQGELNDAGYARALAAALRRSGEIDAMLAAYPGRITLATTADEARRLHAEGKRIAFRSIENCYFVGRDLRALAEFHHVGVRMAGPVHVTTNQLADSSTGNAVWGGLSPLGERWVSEMNRLGIIIDASHASDAAFDRMLELSQAPIALSHSGSRAIFNTPRNIDDARIGALVTQRGIICLATIFLSAIDAGPERLALFRKHGRIYELTPAEQVELARDWNSLDQVKPMWDADFERYMDALLHVIAVAGVDHVGFGADWDGGGGFPGMDDITVHPRITQRLLDAGLSEGDCEKLWSGNLLRVLEENRRVATDAS